jgi:uncharacterized protein
MICEEKLIAESLQLIAALDNPQPAKSEEPDVDKIVQQSVEEPVDASVEISISGDGMTAFASFYPPRGFGRALDPSDVYEQITLAGVSCGIDESCVDESIFTSTTERISLHAVEIAKGRPSRQAVAAYFKPVEENSEGAAEDPEGRVDYRSRSELTLVQSGDTLAVEVAGISGREGMSIRGEVLGYTTVEYASLVPGENTEIVGSRICAVISGVLHVEKGVLSVAPTLVLAGGVNYHSGNVDFDGDIILGGSVSDGFSISCSGMLASTTTIDASGLTCGTLVCRQGLIARTEAPVLVKKDAALRFLQGVTISVGGSLKVKQSVLKSHITAYDRIELGSGSTVVGSTLRAGLEISANSIGAPGAAGSEIYLGIDFHVDERLSIIRDQTLALSEKLREVRSAMKKSSNAKVLNDLEVSLKSAIALLASEAGEIVSGLDRDETAMLIVRGTIYAGTYIEICHRSHIVEKSLSGCIFRLDKTQGMVVSEPLAELHKRRES